MQCENCGEADAVVHLTQIEHNEMATNHLCEKCAAAKGLEPIQPPGNFPLSDFLAQMGDPSAGSETAAPTNPCDFCGLTFTGFRETGRLGCPHCYTTFESHLRGVLRRVHGSTRHTGKVYLTPDPTADERDRRLDGLKRKLERAVEAEDFERAAQIRDQIRALEPV